MKLALYDTLVPWYRLLDPAEDHRDEAASYEAAFERAVQRPCESLLELGAGAGHNAFHLKRRFRCTLTDVAPAMLALSADLNPSCEHVVGDMRNLRLERTFDAVLVHDAIAYMTTEADLRAAAQTAFQHTRPGGAALFAPDCLRESFAEESVLHQGQDGDRSLRCLEWMWDPDPADDTYTTEYAFLLRHGSDVTAVHDRHVEGLFPGDTWRRVLSDVGYGVELIPRPLDDEGATDEVFLCRRLK